MIRKEGKLIAARLDMIGPEQDQLVPVWCNGELLARYGFEDIRQRSESK